MQYDNLDRHLSAAGEFDKAAVPLGMLMAWCANLQLFSPEFEQQHAQLLLRVRMQEVTGSQLLTAAGGHLDREYFNPAGQAFLDSYMDQYMTDFAGVFGADMYATRDSWDNYQLLARVITGKYMAASAAHPPTLPLVNRIKDLWSKWR